MKLSNYLPVNRNLQGHWIYKDSSYLHCWLEMLFNARFSQESKQDVFKGTMYTINRGEFIFSRPTYCSRLGISEGKMRTLLKLLIQANMIELVHSLGKNKPTIYKICNYETYNKQPSEHVGMTNIKGYNNQVATKSQPSDNQVTTKSQPLKNKDNKDNNKEYSVFFEDCWKLYPNKKGKGQISDTKKKEVFKLGEEFTRCISRYVKYVESNDWLKYQNGSTFFNSGYVDYLDANNKDEKTSSGYKVTREEDMDVEYID